MINPYDHPRLPRLKRSAKVRYFWTLLYKFPSYLAWKFSKLFPDEIRQRLRRRFRFLIVPAQNISTFSRLWITTRPWKKLLLALPLLAAVIWILSTLFLANNKTEEELYDDYRSGLFRAMRQKEFPLADFLAGKLLMKPAYAKDKQMLLAAMVSANENRNTSRRDVLLKRLTEELNYSQAHIWSAQRLLATQAGGVRNRQAAIRLVLAALETTDEPEPLRIWLAELYYQSGRFSQAIKIVEEAEDPAPSTSVLLAKLYTSVDEIEKAGSVAEKLLERLDMNDPDKREFANERIEALAILNKSWGDQDYIHENLLGLIELLENKVALANDDASEKSLLAQAYMNLGNLLLRKNSESSRRRALMYYEKSISTGHAPSTIGNALISASNLDSDGGMTEEEISDALVNGESPAVSHVLLGLNSWRKNLMDDVKFHFQLAYKLEPESLIVLEYFSRYIARSSNEGKFKILNFPINFSAENEPLWRRAINLLDIASSLDQARSEKYLDTKCLILSDRQRWKEIASLLDPEIDKVSEEFRIQFLRVLVKAYEEIGNSEKMSQYSEMLKVELAELQEKLYAAEID